MWNFWKKNLVYKKSIQKQTKTTLYIVFILGVALKILHISLSGRTPKILLRFWFVRRWYLTIFQTKCWNPWNFLVPKTSPLTQEILVQSMTLKFRTDVFNGNPHVFNMYFISLPCLLYFRVYFLYLIKVYNFSPMWPGQTSIL